jgi:ABC-type dipeptide/oligopeptide/nickel transport system ATPase component
MRSSIFLSGTPPLMASTKEKLGIVGPNGAGKSTLLKTIVAGLLGGVRMWYPTNTMEGGIYVCIFKGT